MTIKVMSPGNPLSMEPVTCRRSITEIQLAGTTIEKAILKRLEEAGAYTGKHIVIAGDFWPSREIASKLVSAQKEIVICDQDGKAYAWVSELDSQPAKAEKIQMDAKSLVLKYPWDLIAVNEELVSALDQDVIEGTIRSGVNIDGHIVLGKGSVILPGVYIEGNVIIGENCKIGPNCYIRGSTSIGNKCHVGQAVEIKNSILMDKVSAGHLSYIGDSVICANTNLGAGTISSNLRHDGKNHKSDVGGTLVDTGRRKFGCIIGENVHTGIHTSIYPGRKIWADMVTRPGEIVQKDIKL